MISFLADGVLAVALLIMSLRMMTVHRALDQLRAYHQQYEISFEKTAVALAAIRVLLSDADTREYENSSTLVNLIAEARATISKMDTRMPTPDQERLNVVGQHGDLIRKDECEKRITAPAVVGTSHAAFAFCRRVGRPITEAIASG